MIIKFKGYDIEATVEEVVQMMSLEQEPEEPKKKPANHKNLDVGKIKALRDAGWTLKEIADDLKTSPTTIANKLKEIDE